MFMHFAQCNYSLYPLSCPRYIFYLTLFTCGTFLPHTQLWNCFFVTSVKKKERMGKGKSQIIHWMSRQQLPLLFYITQHERDSGLWSSLPQGRDVGQADPWPLSDPAWMHAWRYEWTGTRSWTGDHPGWSFSALSSCLTTWLVAISVRLSPFFLFLVFSHMNTFSIFSEYLPQLCLSFRTGEWDFKLWINVLWIQYFDS